MMSRKSFARTRCFRDVESSLPSMYADCPHNFDIHHTNVDISPPSPRDGADDALQIPQTTSNYRYSLSSSRRPSTYTRSQRSQSVRLSNQDANKLMVEALAIQEQHDLPASDVNRRPSTLSVDNNNNNNNKRPSIRPEVCTANSNLSRSRCSMSVVAEDPSLLFAKALREHQQSKDLFRSESKRREGEEAGTLQPDEDTVNQEQQRPSFSFSRTSPWLEDVSEQQQPRIHTKLSSWTRWPSHTRPERALSATISDGVIVRDFADPAIRRHAFTHETLLHQLQPAGRFPGLRHVTKNIGSVAKYYSTLLTSPRSYRGANRRTSTNVSSGTLVHPELEMVVIGADHDMHALEHHRYLKEVEREFEEKIEEEIVAANRVLSGRVKGKGRATELKLDLEALKATTPASGFDKLAGAKVGKSPFVEKGGFDWDGGQGKSKSELKLDLGAFSFSATSADRPGLARVESKKRVGAPLVEKGGFDWGGSGKKPELKLDLSAFKFGAAADGRPRGMARADSGFDKIEGAKVGMPFVEKSGFDFSSRRSGIDRVDVDPLAAVDEDEEVAP